MNELAEPVPLVRSKPPKLDFSQEFECAAKQGLDEIAFVETGEIPILSGDDSQSVDPQRLCHPQGCDELGKVPTALQGDLEVRCSNEKGH